jgi:hypothetical protein
MDHRKKQRGSAMLEFAFTGVPLIFIWISTVQIALGMWHYDTMQYAVKATGAYLAQHGGGCGTPNTCSLTIGSLAAIMKTNSIGVPATALLMTFKSVSAADHTTVVSTVTCTLNNAVTPSAGCDQNATVWPPAANNSAGSEFEIQAAFQWSPAIGMVAPGSGKAVAFGSFSLPAYTHQVVLF